MRSRALDAVVAAARELGITRARIDHASATAIDAGPLITGEVLEAQIVGRIAATYSTGDDMPDARRLTRTDRIATAGARPPVTCQQVRAHGLTYGVARAQIGRRPTVVVAGIDAPRHAVRSPAHRTTASSTNASTTATTTTATTNATSDHGPSCLIA